MLILGDLLPRNCEYCHVVKVLAEEEATWPRLRRLFHTGVIPMCFLVLNVVRREWYDLCIIIKMPEQSKQLFKRNCCGKYFWINYYFFPFLVSVWIVTSDNLTSKHYVFKFSCLMSHFILFCPIWLTQKILSASNL